MKIAPTSPRKQLPHLSISKPITPTQPTKLYRSSSLPKPRVTYQEKEAERETLDTEDEPEEEADIEAIDAHKEQVNASKGNDNTPTNSL